VDDGIRYELLRVRLRGGEETTVYVVRHPLLTTSTRVVCFAEPRRLDQWCAETSVSEAIVAGFFLGDPSRPLGEVRLDGAPVAHEPVEAPWASARGCVHIADGSIKISPRRELGPDPSGDLVQAGPILVSRGARSSTVKTARASPPPRDNSTPTSPSGATRAAGSGSAAASCWPSAATVGARASTAASSSPSSPSC
jgi:hypothetical protein